jgi:hypothetical protein
LWKYLRASDHGADQKGPNQFGCKSAILDFSDFADPAGLVAIVESNGTTHTPHYTYTDHLGSILTVSNSSFTTIEAEQSFDAWGRRRRTTSWVLEPTQIKILPTWLIRGYTGHEHLYKFGLINMNGRLYDPATGRMLSSDIMSKSPTTPKAITDIAML